MITPRTTRLIRATNLAVFRRAVHDLACQGAPLDARDRLIVVPSRAAASLLTTELERRSLAASGAMLHPEFITSRELPDRFAERAAPLLTASRPEAREILMGVACRTAVESGHPPPFHLRPGLIAEVLDFYDALARRRKDIATFQRLALGRLEPGADYDRGAERLVRQTRFLASAFMAFERLSTERGLVDEHGLRCVAMATPAPRPWRHVVITVGDDARDRYGLCIADWDLLTRVPGLERVDLVVTEQTLAGAWHERVHELLPGIEEVRYGCEPRPAAALRVPAIHSEHKGDARRARPSVLAWEARDREEEIADFTRWTRALHRENPTMSLERIALVVRQPLPYVYLAREVLRSANVPCQTFETLPLAAEPYAAALDLVFSTVNTNVSRASGIALLVSPHFRWLVNDQPAFPASVAAADVLLSERGYLGGLDALQRLVSAASGERKGSIPMAAALPALEVLAGIAAELEPLRSEAPPADHLDTLLAFLIRHDASVADDEPVRSRRLRARAAIQGILAVLRNEYRELDSQPVDFERVAALVRRWIESHTFSPRIGDGGVHLVDAESARFGDFDHVQIAGLVESEWPERPQRNIFYSASVLRDLGWSAESERADHARAAFVDLLGLPSTTLTVSTFSLEDDAVVTASSLLDELDNAALETFEMERDHARIFELEVLATDPVESAGFDDDAKRAIEHRLARPAADESRFHGATSGHTVTAYSLSGLERYQDCPFRFFAHDVLRLTEAPDDEPFLSPRARGRFIHEVFQRFFEAWDAKGAHTITVDNIAAARSLFKDVAEPMLSALGESDAALERTRLFGSAINVGIVDVVLGLEASRPAVVVERWLESSFDGEFSLGHEGGPCVPIRGIADRIDLLEGNQLRVVDYKTGHAPSPSRALQVPVYALCAQERVEQRDGGAWTVAEAAYIAFSGRRALVPVVGIGDDPGPVLDAARARLLEVADGVSRGEFPPRPHDAMLCRACAYQSVCRKDYVNG